MRGGSHSEVHHLPDRHADLKAGKNTLPVLLGTRPVIAVSTATVVAAVMSALVLSRLPQTEAAFRGIVWGAVPHAGLLVLLLYRLATDPADRRIDGVMVVALTYILWFVAIPFWNLL